MGYRTSRALWLLPLALVLAPTLSCSASDSGGREDAVAGAPTAGSAGSGAAGSGAGGASAGSAGASAGGTSAGAGGASAGTGGASAGTGGASAGSGGATAGAGGASAGAGGARAGAGGTSAGAGGTSAGAGGTSAGAGGASAGAGGTSAGAGGASAGAGGNAGAGGSGSVGVSYTVTKFVINTAGSTISATAKVTWDASKLQLLVNVKDATPYDDSVNNWEDDSIEIYLDMNHAKSTTYQADDVQIVVPRTAGALSGIGVFTASAITVVRSEVTGGYVLDVSIPWSSLNGLGSQLGKTIGFDLAVNDDLNGGTRDAQLMLFGTDQAFNNTSVFGDLTLN